MTRTAAQIRQDFIDFFTKKHGHAFVPSNPVVPLDDPTLLFTNAGMNQFKPYFLGTQTPPHKRVANTQKCIRAGGKHNDLDDVGHDTYHHTFFEMLGNWSFGDYFKAEAIAWAWELLTQVWGIDPTRLHATYFGGDESEGLALDSEARDLWLRILPAQRVHPGNKKDNFWEMGDTGPCGPCSEIHIDLTPDKSGGQLVNAGDARVMEIWNLVFIQFNRGPDGKLTPLPAKHVDTGMGFERVSAVLQGHNNNYATEVFVPLIQAIEKLSGHVYGGPGAGSGVRDAGLRAQGGASPPAGGAGLWPVPNRYALMRAGNMQDEACRVIADHIRCLTFALTDGAVPDREGRGYVLRRILRRAVRFGYQYLNLHQPFLCDLVPTVAQMMGDAFPELRKDPARVAALIREEEESFGRTLSRGIDLFNQAAELARTEHHNEIRGEDAFKLHDTYGFPIDLTQIMAAERGLRVDIGEYELLMDDAKERARAGGKGFAATHAAIPPELIAEFGPTDTGPKYETATLTAQVRALVKFTPDGVQMVEEGGALQPGDNAAVIFDRTCFYAEAGGQIGDQGTLGGGGVRFDVEDTQTIADVVVHLGTLVMGEIRLGDQLLLQVDSHREATRKNHTATHVLNWALREVLGAHVQQKGSLVDPEKTRFDFSHPKALTPAEIARIEQLVNDQIAAKLPVHTQVVPQAEALKINGLRAVFGERYPDHVRVMCIGVPVADLLAEPASPRWRQYSIEFCGGTHVANTADIGHFVLASEEAVAKGVRRVVGMTGDTAALTAECGKALVQRAQTLRTSPPADLPQAVSELQNTLAAALLPLRDRVRLREILEDLQRSLKQHQKAATADAAADLKGQVDALLAGAARFGQTSVIVAELPDVPVEALKTTADTLKQKAHSAALFFGTRPDQGGDRAGAVAATPGKVTLLAAVTDDLVQRGVKAGDWVKAVAPIVEGGGGGAPTMAQAGGKNPAKLPEALEAARAWIRGKLG